VALKEVIRARFPQEQDAVPRPDPEGNEVRATLNYYYYTGCVVIHADVQIPIIRNVFIYITYTNSNIIILVACICVQVYVVTYRDLFQAKWPVVKDAPVRRQGASSRD